jgi:uncharacterized damage-inducible protein DinB
MKEERPMNAPQFPAGAFVPELNLGSKRRTELIEQIRDAAANLRTAVAGLSESQLDTRYKNWTIRQIVHHLADSHVNSYIRFKWTLTEEQPTIKAYDEGRWAALEDSLRGDVAAPLALLDGVHRRWVQLLETMSADQFARAFFHPETSEVVTLNAALAYYAWHGKHHTAQISWLREQKNW